MHVTQSQAALLSNHEVFVHLQAVQAEHDGTDGTGRERPQPPGLKNTLRDTLTYFESHAEMHTLSDATAAHPERPATLYKGPHSLLKALGTKYRINKTEFLQIYNLKPTTQVELQIIIEESHVRFTEAQLDDMLAIIAHVFEEDETTIPPGVEDQKMDKIPRKLLGPPRMRRRTVKKA